MNDWQRSLRQERDHDDHQHQHQHQQRSKMPSFSSSLLDAIYRSIDESKHEAAETTATTTKVMKKQRNINLSRKDAVEDERSLRKALAFEKLMESDDERRSRVVARGFSRTACNSASSSSDSSCGGVFSSSETESVNRDGPKSVSFTIPRPDRVRGDRCSVGSEYENTPKRDERLLMRTKSKALKLYGDLKKVKQPISPGRRITSFLNSLFNSRNAKNRIKRESLDGLGSLRRTRSVNKDHHHQTTTCSLSSSFSRSSCLPPSSTSRASKFTSSNNNCSSKRSVRFCLVDEDPRRCGKKEDPRIMPTPIVRKIAEIAVMEKEVVKNVMSDKRRSRGFEDEDLDEDEEEYDDGMSCTSSDLFELENIGASAGVGSAYREELPVYGTTSLNGLIL